MTRLWWFTAGGVLASDPLLLIDSQWLQSQHHQRHPCKVTTPVGGVTVGHCSKCYTEHCDAAHDWITQEKDVCWVVTFMSQQRSLQTTVAHQHKSLRGHTRSIYEWTQNKDNNHQTKRLYTGPPASVPSNTTSDWCKQVGNTVSAQHTGHHLSGWRHLSSILSGSRSGHACSTLLQAGQPKSGDGGIWQGVVCGSAAEEGSSSGLRGREGLWSPDLQHQQISTDNMDYRLGTNTHFYNWFTASRLCTHTAAAAALSHRGIENRNSCNTGAEPWNERLRIDTELNSTTTDAGI